MDRIYSSFGIVELERLTDQAWGIATDLVKIEHELGFRTTSRARHLLLKVQDRIRTLRSGSRAESSESEGGSHANASRPGDGANSDVAELFQRVGLHVDAPPFLIKAARKAFRAQYHPDRRATDAEKRDAEERFKQFDSIFDRIEQM